MEQHTDRTTATDSQNGAKSETPPEPQGPSEREDREAVAKMARIASQEVGGLIARVDQLETKIARLDRQTLMLVGMVTLCIYGIKTLHGKVGVDAAPLAPAS